MKREGKMQIDIIIDELTDCLKRRKDGTTVETEYRKLETPIKKKDFSGWKFNWSTPQKNGYDVYELFLKGNSEIEGRIALTLKPGYVEVDVIESNPKNIGSKGEYIGVGGHLFAIACLISFNNGYEGYVAFTAKTNLIDHYIKSLGANVLSGQRLCIEESAARELVNKYLEMEV